MSYTRIVAIRHRMKALASGEVNPTEILIRDLATGSEQILKFLSQDEELLFLHGQYQAEKDGPLIGLHAGDLVATMLGGSGDAFVFALAGHYLKQDVTFIRTPSFRIRDYRPDPDDSSQDVYVIADMAQADEEDFYPITEKDLQFIFITQAWPAYERAMKARMAYTQRLAKISHDEAYVLASDIAPREVFDKKGKRKGVTDAGLEALEKEESLRLHALEHALGELDIYRDIFEPIEGIGPKLAGRLISAIIDIRRFPDEAKLMAYLGVHTIADGDSRGFPRQRRGQRANWNSTARQALFLLAEQANKRPGSKWGQELRSAKARLRAKHPLPIKIPRKVGVDGDGETLVTKYSDAHIHKMASWRMATRFVRYLYRAWYRELDLIPPRKRQLRLRKAA